MLQDCQGGRGEIEARAAELTEKLHDAKRKPVLAKDLAMTIEQFESELREFEAITGKPPDEHAKALALKRMLPPSIRQMLQTVEKTTYKLCKEYALKQAREMRNERSGDDSSGKTIPGRLGDLDHVDDEEGGEGEDDPEALALQKKGKGNGFKGECYNCGKTGHRAADCWAPGGGKEGGQKGQKGGYGKGGGIMEAVLGQGYDKGKGKKGKPWGKGQKGGYYGKGKGGPYSFEDDGMG